MLGGYTLRVIPLSSHSIQSCKKPSGHGFLGRPVIVAKRNLNVSATDGNFIGKIRERLNDGKVEISPSAYDTAWVAMVPARGYSGSKQPCFPQCLDWIMENQNPDGSWGLQYPGHPLLVKDSLSCTLACVLALRNWDVGQQLVERGLDFIRSHGWAASNKDQFSPVGFSVIFPAMINYAKEQFLTDGVHHGNLIPGSAILFTCTFTHTVHINCSLLVPTMYPMDIYTHLRLVDTLERLGVSRYFGHEIGCILDEMYRCWQGKEEEIFSDINCRAMAFRLLRTKGYNVSSDELAEFIDREHFFNMVGIQYSGVTTVLELFRASQMRIYKEEAILEKIHAWTSDFLKQQLLSGSILDKRLHKQVGYDLKNFHGARQLIMKISSNSLCKISVFPRLNTKKNFSKLRAVIVDPGLSTARMSYAQVIVLVTCLDDFLIFMDLEKKPSVLSNYWNMQPAKTDLTEEAEILFTALYKTVNEVAAEAYATQGRCIKHDLVSMAEILTNFARTKEPWSDSKRPTLDEYLSFAWKTIACELCVLTSIHFLGIKLSADMFTCAEFTSLCKNASLVCRLLNDLKTFKRECEERALNSVSVQTVEGSISEEEAISKVKQIIEDGLST
ncbi:UNVERIFIED_CONTAM: Cis-abienol synthase, chloroplastic [Sesamum radiatum]|uniref:Cis-abienol synthase, chloroplastic n=1 Tax=Sesamum radiatum TaxID=300843 RepID=A0AAW2MH80_SESRA